MNRPQIELKAIDSNLVKYKHTGPFIWLGYIYHLNVIQWKNVPGIWRNAIRIVIYISKNIF